MMLSEVVTVETEPYSKIGRTHCLQIRIKVAGLGPHFLLIKSLRRWYLVLQRSRMSSKCFLKLSWESKVMPKKTSLEDRFLVHVSRHIVSG